jgi:hypothetical protein
VSNPAICRLDLSPRLVRTEKSPIFTSGMGRYFTLIYWSAAVLLVSLVLWSVAGSFGVALLLAVALLPGVMFFKFFVRDLSFDKRREGVFHSIYFAGAVMCIEYLCIFFVYLAVYENPFVVTPPEVVTNPLFLWWLLAALLSMEYLLTAKLFKRWEPVRSKFISFTSDRRKISLELSRIVYIESHDYEVVVVTVDGAAHPTRMKISQWETVLDDRFVRIHRSFIVNRDHVTRIEGHTVWLGDTAIEISRKYRNATGIK